MLFVVVFCLVAAATAEREIQQDLPVFVSQPIPIQRQLEQQMVEDQNAIRLYKQIPDPTPLSNGRLDSSSLREGRFNPYFEEIKENYPFLPYNYKSVMGYPARSNYFLRVMSQPVAQPKIDYESKEYYHQHDVKHHHIVNNIHDFKQKHILRNFDQDTVSPYLPSSPMYYNNLNMFNKGYPYGYKPYSRGLEHELEQPLINSYYNKFWDSEYLRNYYGNSNYEVPTPYMYRNWVKPFLYRGLDYVQPATQDGLNAGQVIPRFAKKINYGINYGHSIIPGFSTGSSLEKGSDYMQPDRVELTHQAPADVGKHQNIVSQEQTPQEGRKVGIQLDANVKEQAPIIQAEDHISQQPIHRQTRA